MQKPGGIIALLDEAWYVHSTFGYNFSFLLRIVGKLPTNF